MAIKGSIAGLPLALVMVMVMLVACGSAPEPEQQIRHRLASMIEALEEGDVGEFMDPIADDFVAGDRALDRRALGLLVRRERMARDSIRVRRVNTRVELHGEQRATATFQALATGGSGLIPDEGRMWDIETGWRLDGDDWMLISASWSRGI